MNKCSFILLIAAICLFAPALCTEKDVEDILNLKGIDLNSDGEITLEEFQTFVMGMPNVREHYTE